LGKADAGDRQHDQAPRRRGRNKARGERTGPRERPERRQRLHLLLFGRKLKFEFYPEQKSAGGGGWFGAKRPEKA
jgi:hypothetical protein